MLADIIEVTTADGITLGGAYFAPRAVANDSSIDALCFFHGDGGHFYRSLYLDLGHRLAELGIAFITANRRGHDIVAGGAPGGPPKGYAYESVDESRFDYAAWLEFLAQRGHRSVAIGGHSGGAVRSVYAQSKEHYASVRAVVAVSPGEYNHEGVVALHGDLFADTFSKAEREIAEGRTETLYKPGIPWGSTWTAEAFVDCFNPDGRYSVNQRVLETSCPTLFVFGSEECAGPQELPVCGAAMRRLRSANHPHVTVEVIDGANHGYQDRDAQLFETIHGWLGTV
ncbi:MAG: alpha/beta hydrolase [SAR202 cluster bacterium]|nr:alpha/beta hydrolase [SAR202 cluster bacterium]MDP6664868.1 alpha/beta hydrolase [SAR202 cluster bacterium]MDP6799791.1 alpha/beta hydrolase [SAR202 cluster bacterium]